MIRTCKVSAPVAFSFVLAACAGDNPENVPVYGQWQNVRMLDSVSLDGRALPPENFKQMFDELDVTETLCGEPMFIDRDWQQRDINRKVRGSCRLTSYEVTPSRVTGEGTCTGVAPEANFNPDFRLDIAQSPQSYRIVLTIEGYADVPDMQGRHLLKAIAVQEGTRSAEC